MIQDDILNRQLHTFETRELGEIRRLADTIFEPLVRPFRQHRTEERFSVAGTIRNAMRLGSFMPAYRHVAREHRKSRLVIAMSLSGIDRCSAVSLIPLFSCLKQTALDFRLWIYTDDLVEAEFTHDGFLANDWKIAWNNVAGPVVFSRLAEMPVDGQEDTLLLIDSLGGGDSRWYDHWSWDDRQEVQQEQQKYLVTAGPQSWAARIRKELQGDYTRLSKINLPKAWENLIINNTQKRWMETPALHDYIVRWLFNPHFGEVQHGQYIAPHNCATDILRRLKGKFRNMHLLTPNMKEGNYLLNEIIRQNVFDYHHKANTVSGFAEVLASIVHGQSIFDGNFTRKISWEVIKVADAASFLNDEEEEMAPDAGGPGEDEHSNVMVAGAKSCFADCPPVPQSVPSPTSITVDKGNKRTKNITTDEIPFNEVCIALLPSNLQHWRQDSFWVHTAMLDFNIEPGDSEYTQLTKARRALESVATQQLVCSHGNTVTGNATYSVACGNNIQRTQRRPLNEVQQKQLQCLLAGIEYDKHRTQAMRQNTEDFMRMLAPSYLPYMTQLPLKNVVWCTLGKFDDDSMSISTEPTKNGDGRRRTLWHEAGHWLEHVCPQVGCFTNQLLRQKCNADSATRNEMVKVHKGEYAMPVEDGSTAWITPYAGKWYARDHRELPNDTEVLSVHAEYFTSAENLLLLMKHDPFMVKFIGFILMGGPIAAVESIKEYYYRTALRNVEQRSRGSKGYTSRRGGGRGRGGYGSAPKVKREKRFGL